MRFKIEQHFVAICLTFSAVCFGAGLLLQHGARAVDRALTWGAR